LASFTDLTTNSRRAHSMAISSPPIRM